LAWADTETGGRMFEAVPETKAKLAVFATIKEGITIGAKNIGPILANVLLWAATIWIPYLNVGTTIGLTVGIVAKASRGEAIPATEVFNPRYRKYMGEFFLVFGLMSIGITVGFIFFIIPGIVIGLAWSLAILLVVDKGKNPTEALTMSNDRTYGHKWKIFGVYFFASLLFFIIMCILGVIGSNLLDDAAIAFVSLLAVLITFFWIFVYIGLQASIYKQLGENFTGILTGTIE